MRKGGIHYPHNKKLASAFCPGIAPCNRVGSAVSVQQVLGVSVNAARLETSLDRLLHILWNTRLAVLVKLLNRL